MVHGDLRHWAPPTVDHRNSEALKAEAPDRHLQRDLRPVTEGWQRPGLRLLKPFPLLKHDRAELQPSVPERNTQFQASSDQLLLHQAGQTRLAGLAAPVRVRVGVDGKGTEATGVQPEAKTSPNPSIGVRQPGVNVGGSSCILGGRRS